jgi:hypothetical protein
MINRLIDIFRLDYNGDYNGYGRSGNVFSESLFKTSKLAVTRGHDCHKKVNGRKRHIASDTLGFPLVVKVHDANLSDRNQEEFQLAVPFNLLILLTSR